MKTTIIKFFAKVALDNLGYVVAWILNCAAENLIAGNEKAQKAVEIAEKVSETAGRIACAAKDGILTEEEQTEIVSQVNDLAKEIKGIL